MLKKMVLAASAAVVVLGAGTAALATSTSAPAKPSVAGTSSPAPSGSTAPGAAAPNSTAPGAAAPDRAARGPKAHKPALKALGRALHATWVTPDRDSENTFVTHHAIRGEVTAVSPTSLTVKALDGFTQTYAVNGDTKVHLRKGLPSQGNGKGNGAQGNRGGLGKGPAGTISDVHTGDKVAVTGTGTTSLTAQHVVDATP
jgi:hypothetical protein